VFLRKLVLLTSLTALAVSGCVSAPPPEQEPARVEAKAEIDKSECSGLGIEVQVLQMNLEARELLRTSVSLDGIANTATRMKQDASSEAARELEALRTASIDLKNWLDNGEGDLETSFSAFEAAFNNVVKICNRQ
jgi:hypothetical protein